MYIHPNPQLVGRMFYSSQRRALFIYTVFTVRDILRRGQINLAPFTLPDTGELPLRPVDKSLAVKGVE
jgi:hypothetical protein